MASTTATIPQWAFSSLALGGSELTFNGMQPTLYALWRSFTQCTFIEPEGGVVFFKNQQGKALREHREPAASNPSLEKAENAPEVAVEPEIDEDTLKMAGFTS